jgi:RimJ/RimL family protein N-acetyltransferase
MPQAFSGKGARLIDIVNLTQPMADPQWLGGEIKLAPAVEAHREGLRSVCDPKDPVWQIYPVNLSGLYFDQSFDMMLANTGWHSFAILLNDKEVGITRLINLKLDQQALEIGGTYMAQDVRGTGLNGRVKALLLDRVFSCGVRRVEFRVDERNKRSQAAVVKLGCTKEGVLRAERITWTGHIRDTGVFSILAEEWRAQNPIIA